ncbi:MAG TPA: DUF6282 family protein [Candidatus Dormibacteraeota bacterium]|nr:DUF6282 family protein [Candidatus Dormibacteraeota bacterium]
MTVDLQGAADLHVHFGPDAHRERSVTALQAAREAAECGHAALVLKSHDYPTPAVAAVVDQSVDGVRVYGGITCDRENGGVNPSAVDVALRLGAKVVWLPTLSGRQDVANGIAARLGIPGPGITVCADDGRLLESTQEVIELVVASGAVLATGHVSAIEHRAVAEAMRGRGRVLVTHAMEAHVGPNLSVDQCVELAEIGAVIELCALTCLGTYATRSVDALAACIRAVGAERCTLASDLGQAGNPHPAEGLQRFADLLVAAGVAEGDVRRMACANPCALLGFGP